MPALATKGSAYEGKRRHRRFVETAQRADEPQGTHGQVLRFSARSSDREAKEAVSASFDGEAVLRRLARRRTGDIDVDLAFDRDELTRLRRFFALAETANCRFARAPGRG